MAKFRKQNLLIDNDQFIYFGNEDSASMHGATNITENLVILKGVLNITNAVDENPIVMQPIDSSSGDGEFSMGDNRSYGFSVIAKNHVMELALNNTTSGSFSIGEQGVVVTSQNIIINDNKRLLGTSSWAESSSYATNAGGSDYQDIFNGILNSPSFGFYPMVAVNGNVGSQELIEAPISFISESSAGVRVVRIEADGLYISARTGGDGTMLFIPPSGSNNEGTFAIQNSNLAGDGYILRAGLTEGEEYFSFNGGGDINNQFLIDANGDVGVSGSLSVSSSAVSTSFFMGGNVGINDNNPLGRFSVNYGSGPSLTGLIDAVGEGYGDILEVDEWTGTIVSGSLVFLLSDGTWKNTDTSHEDSGSDSLMGVAVIDNKVLLKGFIYTTAIGGTANIGDKIFASGSGAYSASADEVSAHWNRVLGYRVGGTENQIYFNPSNDWSVNS